MKYYVRGRAYILSGGIDAANGGMPCSTIVEASSKEEAEEKGLKKLEKELSNFQEIEVIEVGKVTKDYPNFLD